MHLILVRHGNTFEAHQTPVQVGARTDLPLTAQGRNQAIALATYFATLRPAAIYTGPLKRQIETAQLLNGPLPIFHPALTELDYGAWEGLTAEEIALRWPTEYIEWNEKAHWPTAIFKGTLQDHLQQLEQWLQLLRTTYKQNDTVIGVTSNGLLRLFYSLTGAKQPAPKVKTGHFCELELLPTALLVKSWNQKLA